MAYAGEDFSDVDGTFETESFSFDFTLTRNLASDPINSVVWNLTVVAGVDASPSSRIVSQSIGPGQKCSIVLTNLQFPARYRIQAVATFVSGEVKSLFSFILSRALTTFGE